MYDFGDIAGRISQQKCENAPECIECQLIFTKYNIYFCVFNDRLYTLCCYNAFGICNTWQETCDSTKSLVLFFEQFSCYADIISYFFSCRVVCQKPTAGIDHCDTDFSGVSWFASKKDFSDNLVEDHKIRTELKAQLKDAGVPKIEIERTVDPSTSAPRVTVNIYCAKPGMVIGKGGEERVALQNKLTKEYGKTVIVNVIEVKSASTNAQLVAEDIARQLENRVTFRRAMKQCMRNAMSPRDRSTVPAKGIKAMCSGRLGGADIARTESYHEGTIPLQTLRADIDYGFAEAATTYGRIGVKVWVYKGEVLKSAKTAQKKEGGNK